MSSAVVQKGVLLASFLLAGFLFLYEPPYFEAGTIGKGVESFSDIETRFRTLAQEKGGVYAFDILSRATLPAGTDVHLLGHVVGDELYAQQGINGIAACTQEFRNACSHSIVIGALEEYGGAEALELVRAACRKAPGGSGAYTMCYHGLGHGVLAFYGYDLREAVRFCEQTGTKEYQGREYTECVGGAVMELMGGGGHDRERWLESREQYLSGDPLSLCRGDVVPEDAKPLCLLYLTPHLWEYVGIDLARPDPALFPKAFSLCERIPARERPERDACFAGFGKEFIPIAGAGDIRTIAELSDDAFKRALEWCGLASSEDGQAACVGEAVASVFWGGENDPEASFRFCALAPSGALQSACHARLAEDIAAYMNDERVRDALCERIPEENRSSCALHAAIP